MRETRFIAIRDCVLRRVFAAEMILEPFPHFVATNVFEQDFYDELLASIPAQDEVARLRKNVVGVRPGRTMLDTDSFDSSFWNDFTECFGGALFADRLLRKLGKTFDENNYVTTQLMQDRTGYGIGPHTDITSKKMTLLFYLPVDKSLQRFGTSICRTRDESLIGNQNHHSWDCFEESHRVLFQPNTALGFCRTDESFHAVQTISEDIVRNSISITIRVR